MYSPKALALESGERVMNTNASPPSAKIYQFPVRPSPTRAGFGRDLRGLVDPRLLGFPVVDFGSGWYHEAAMKADTVRKS